MALTTRPVSSTDSSTDHDMPTLYLFRHAKSDWSDRSLDDHDRPLAPRGRRAAPAMAGYMEAEGLVPRLVLCSTATRTRQTWDLMEERLGAHAAVIWEEELYGASPREILRILSRLDEETSRVMVVGHNPGMEETARSLVGSGDPDDRERLRRKFPTAALAVLEADVPAWDRLEPECCVLERFVRPKDLPEVDELGL